MKTQKRNPDRELADSLSLELQDCRAKLEESRREADQLRADADRSIRTLVARLSALEEQRNQALTQAATWHAEYLLAHPAPTT